MSETAFEQLVFAAGNHNVSRETFTALEAYAALLLTWQKAVNLISPHDIPHFWQRHLCDSAQLAEHIPLGAHVLDIGSGGGLPGIVLATLHPTCAFTLVESDQKKCVFLLEARRILNLQNTTIQNIRLETLPARHYDTITARAFAPLGKLLSLSMPYFGPHTTAILPKGKDVEKELTEASQAWEFTVQHNRSRTSTEAAILLLQHLRRRS